MKKFLMLRDGGYPRLSRLSLFKVTVLSSKSSTDLIQVLEPVCRTNDRSTDG